MTESPKNAIRTATERLSSSPAISQSPTFLSNPGSPSNSERRAIQRYLPRTQNPDTVTSSPYTLQGTAITNDIHKWAADPLDDARQRSNSVPALNLTPANDLLMPGGFRRHYIMQQGNNNGGVNQTFIDFLGLYGHFAGDEYPEDQEEDEGGLESGEDEPLLENAQQPKKASVSKVFLLLIKSFVGTGVLFLPRGFYNGGMTFSIVVLCVLSYLCLYCMLLLIECRNVVHGSFGEIGGRLYGPRMKQAVLASIAISQLGFSCAYTIFVATTLRDLVMATTDCEIVPPMWLLIFGQLGVYIPLAMIRKIKHLSHTALVADVFIVAGISYLFYYNFYLLFEKGTMPIQHVNWEGMSLFVGTAIFTFEGIGLIIPIVESMQEPQKFPRVLSLTMLLVVVVFLAVGSLSYLVFGSTVETVVLLNLPTDDPLVALIQLLYTLAIVFSVPLQLFPAIGIFERSVFFPPATTPSGKFDTRVKWQKNILRAGTAILVAVLSFLGANSLDRVVSLIGSFACLPLSFVYPALFHYKAVAVTPRQKALDIILVIFGITMMIFTTAQTLMNWNEAQSKPPARCS